MLAWSTEMNTIMKGTLTKIFGYLGQKINHSEKKQFAFWRLAYIIFTKESTKWNINFSTFAPCFLVFCKSTLTPFSLKIITSILVWDYKISDQENIIEPWPLTSFFQIKIIICNSLWLTFMKWITLMVRISMDIPKIKII